MHHSKLLAVAVLATVAFAACAAPAAQPPTAYPTTAPAPAAAPTPMPQPAAQAGPTTVKTASDAKLGTILTDAKGMTLYMFTKDEPNTSNCYDQCAQNWPPLLSSSGDPAAGAGVTGKLGLTTRKDGAKQVTYNGMPLYYWYKDTNPGDTNGQGVGNIWFVVNPGAAGFPTVKIAADQKLGTILTDLKGMTLYRFTNDAANTSTCYDQCAQNWPPLLASSGDPVLAGGLAGKLGVTTRKDGSQQVTYNGTPLYYWAKDAKPGDTNGQGVGSVWFVVEPKAGQ